MHESSENVSPSDWGNAPWAEVDWGDSTPNAMGQVVVMICTAFVAVAMIGLAVYVYGNAARYDRIMRLWGLVLRGGHLFLLGIGALLPFAILGGIAYLFARLPSGTQNKIGIALLIILAACLFVIGIGWIAEKWLKRIREHQQTFSESTETN